MAFTRRIIIVGVLAAGGLLLVVDVNAIPHIGDMAPNFYLKTLDNEPFNLKEHCGTSELLGAEGKSHVILIFFNTTCIPCIRLIYEVKIIYEKYQHKNFKVFLVAIDKEKIEALSLFKYRHKVKCPIIIDKYNIVAKIYGAAQTIPTVYLIDKKGKVRFSKFGFSATVKGELQSEMKKLDKLDAKEEREAAETESNE